MSTSIKINTGLTTTGLLIPVSSSTPSHVIMFTMTRAHVSEYGYTKDDTQP